MYFKYKRKHLMLCSYVWRTKPMIQFHSTMSSQKCRSLHCDKCHFNVLLHDGVSFYEITSNITNRRTSFQIFVSILYFPSYHDSQVLLNWYVWLWYGLWNHHLTCVKVLLKKIHIFMVFTHIQWSNTKLFLLWIGYYG